MEGFTQPRWSGARCASPTVDRGAGRGDSRIRIFLSSVGSESAIGEGGRPDARRRRKVSSNSDASSTGSRGSAWTATQTEMPMMTPLVSGICPCGRRGGEDGFCDEHAGAVAFKVPVGPDGDVLPAVWWHWAHLTPCPQGEGWMIRVPSGSTGEAMWACTHRMHELSGEHDLSEEATG
jgi:hypothetical protein